MSMELTVYCDRARLPKPAAWAKAIGGKGVKFAFPKGFDWEHGGGNVPVTLNQIEAGFELYAGENEGEDAGDFPSPAARKMNFCAELVYRSDEEAAAALLAAAALASLTGGLLYNARGEKEKPEKAVRSGLFLLKKASTASRPTKNRWDVFARKHPLPHLEGWAVRDAFLYRTPVGEVFRGVCFNRHKYDANRFRFDAAVVPLYLPYTSVPLSNGKAFGEDWAYEKAKEKRLAERLLKVVREEVEPFLEQRATPARLAKAWGDPLVLVQAGKLAAAVKALDRSTRRMRKEQAADPELWSRWDDTQLERLEEVRKLLPAKAEAARKLLAKWAAQTRKQLKLADG